MPTTRSGRTDTSATREDARTTTEESASTETTASTEQSSATTTTSATATTPATATATAPTSATATATETAVETEKIEKPKSLKSHHTAKKRDKAIKLARAQEELLKLQTKLAAARIATMELEDDSDDDDSIATDREASQRVTTWLESTPIIAAPEDPPVAVKNIEEIPVPRESIEDSKIEKRIEDASAPPGHINLSELASAIALAARSGPTSVRPIELPTFAGSHQDWLAFRATFEETAKAYREIENIGRLRHALRGRAREAVENLLLYNGETKQIMKTLEDRFGRPDSIALAEMERLRALPRLTDSPRDVCIFASRIANTVATLRALRKLHYLYNPEAVKITIEKLTPALRYRWFDYAAEEHKEEPELEKLSRFLNREADRCGPYAQPEAQTEQPLSANTRQRQKVYSANENRADKRSNSSDEGRHIDNKNNNNIEKCTNCSSENHDIVRCKKFIDASVSERWDIAKEKRLCFACLHYRTRTHHCRRRRCAIDDCNYWHHRLLHHRKFNNETVASTWIARGFTSYLKIVPVHISGPVGGVDTYALLDDGSTVTLIDENIAQQAGVTGPLEPLQIEAIGDHRLSARTRRVNVTIRGTSGHPFKIQARTIANLKLSAQAVAERDVGDCEHLRDIRQHLLYAGAKPQILIGQDNWHLLLASDVRRGQRDQPVASNTPLGWVLHGARARSSNRIQRVHFITSPDEEMNEQLKRYFAIESVLIEPKQPSNSQEQRALKKLEAEVIERDGRYETPLLWKRDEIVMPPNYENTLRRLHTIEKKLDRDPQLNEKYTEQMEALIEKGYAERAPPQRSENRTWYLPHFAVVNPMKPGKIRIVHDAAAKTRGVSLNDHLLKGPDLIQSLPGVLMRFRQRKIAVTADIREMFMQIKVKNEDRDALRYLWRGNRRDNAPPDEYRMTSLIFGATCSPAIAIYIKNRNAAKYASTDTREYDAIVRNHYVDDLLNSYDTEEEAIHAARRIAKIHSEANYELRQWSSNSNRVVNTLEPHAAKPVVTLDMSDNIERVLGVIWRPASDDLGFNLNLARLPPDAIDNARPTKRETLRILMSLFDPLGLASPVTIRAKQILQEIWRRGTDWDEAIDEDLSVQWIEWTRQLKNLRDITTPRCYPHYSAATSLQLHIFVDASESAYSAVAYWRAIDSQGVPHISLVAAKAKVCPLKLTSVPRLELQAAVMGSRMGRTIVDEHDVKPERTIYWTDSKTVLTWLKTGSRSYRPFVAHRIAAIEENSALPDWRWIPTKMNVADDATRDIPANFNSEHRWYTGPRFLRDDPTTWPSERPTLDVPTGEEKVHHVKSVEISLRAAVPEPTRFSKWERLLRSTARVLQFIDLCRPKNRVHYKRHRKNQPRDAEWTNKRAKPVKIRKQIVQSEDKYIAINAAYIKKAEQILMKLSQSDSFAEELSDIECAKKGRLRSLSIEIIDGVIKIKSRIAAAENILEQQKSPIVLSGDNYITRLYIEYIHRRLHHAGTEATINECRAKYWITRLRPTTRVIIHRCVQCRVRKNTPPEPPTGDLPPCRLAHHQRPFSYTGVDYFGPLTVTVGRAIQKRYVALFTCLTTRAVHLEVAPSLNTESAVMAVRRFIARRGCPAELWSDNGTNLRGADKDLRRAIDSAIEKEAGTRAISWRFIPPGAPFMGGAWERLVRSVKTSLFAAMNERHPSDEVLLTTLAEVEFTVNNRPLTHVSIDPEDPEAITPNHFLLLGPAMNPAPGTFSDRDLVSRHHWRTAQRLADMFWERWLKEYLPDLQQRREPHGRGIEFSVGDVVLIVDNTLPRNTWPMGRIVKTYPGGDGVVRAVDVRTKGGVLRRPCKKMVLITSEDRSLTSV